MKTLPLILLLLLPSLASAQTPVPSPTPPSTELAFDHDGVNTDGYAIVVDGVRQNLGRLTPVADGSYRIPFPALTPGDHTLQIVAYNIAGDATSATLSVRLVVIPSAPTNLRIVQGDE